MKKFTFSFRPLVKMIADPVLHALYRLVDVYRGDTKQTTVNLTGQVEASIPITESGDIVGDVKVLHSSHTHTAGQVDHTALASPSAIVARTSTKDIIARGTTVDDTGYKLADGKDISTVFVGKDVPLFKTKLDIKHTDNPTAKGNSIVAKDATLRIEGDTLVLELQTIRYCG